MRIAPFSLALGLAVTGACTSTPPAEPAKEAKVEPTQAKAPTPAEVEPTKADPPAPAPSVLRAVAVREGPMTLMHQRDEPLVVIDGEPLTLVDGVPTRHPAGSAGLRESYETEGVYEGVAMLAAVSLDGLGAWTSIEHLSMRSASLHDAYQRKDDHWEPVALRKGLLLAYYAAFVEREGSLLALRSWAADPSQEVPDAGDPPEATVYQKKLERELSRVKQGFIRLAGAEPTALPEIPEGARVDGSVATMADGSLLALAQERTAMEEGDTTILLVWRPGQTKAERVEVPELAAVEEAKLDVNGEWTLVFGQDGESESYLALGRGSDWQRAPVSLIGHLDGATSTISGAARLPDGELWISLASDVMREPDPKPVWRKPVGGPWQVAPLPVVDRSTFDPARAPGEAFVPDQAPGLRWAAGAVWVVVGGDTNQETEVDTAPSTTVLFTTLPGTAAPIELPSSEQLELERKAHAARSAKQKDAQP